MHERSQIEVDAGHHEEHGDEEAEPDGLELALDRLGLAPCGHEPDDDTGGEHAEEHVQSELLGQQDKQYDEQQ